MKCFKLWLLAVMVFLYLADIAPVSAAKPVDKPVDKNLSAPGNGWGPPSSRGSPGPLAGAGLPFLVAAGAAGAYRVIRRRGKSRQQDG
jgi:hypothetical protein